MSLFEAYGLKVETTWELPGFSLAAGKADVLLEEAPISTAIERLHNGGDTVAGIFPGQFRFVSVKGEFVQFETQPGCIPEVVQAYLANFVLGVVLRQRGYLPIHASSVALGPHVVLFAGNSGTGKSTTAEYFLSRGYSLLAEDSSVLDLAAGNIRVLPGPKRIKLRPQAAAWLHDDVTELARFYDATDVRVRTEGIPYCSEPATLSHIYVFSHQSCQQNQVVSLRPVAALLELIRHTRATGVFNSHEIAAIHLSQCEQVVQAVPVRQLKRTMRLDDLPMIYELVNDDLSRTHSSYLV